MQIILILILAFALIAYLSFGVSYAIALLLLAMREATSAKEFNRERAIQIGAAIVVAFFIWPMMAGGSIAEARAKILRLIRGDQEVG